VQGAPFGRTPPLRPVPDPVADGPGEPPADELEPPEYGSIVERAYLIAIGLASLAASAIVEAIVGSMDPREPRRPDDAATTGLPVLAGAAMGAMAETGSFVIRAGLQAVRMASGMASGLMEAVVGVERSAWVFDRVGEADARARDERDRAQVAAEAFATVLLPPIVDAILDRIDLTELVAERVDLDAVIATVDLNRVVDEVDLMRAVDRIPLDDVAARLDVDAVASRLDVQAVIDRVDLVAIAESLIAELDLPEIIRTSSGAMAAETVDGIRIRGMDADRLLTRIVDRVLARKREEAAGASSEPGDGDGAP
jgi:hypothetical protein